MTYDNNIDWNHNPPFNHGVYLNSTYQDQVTEAVNELISDRSRIRNLHEKCRDYSALIGNLVANNPVPTSISMNRKDWVPKAYRTAGYFVPELVRLLEKRGDVSRKKGNQFSKRVSRVLAGDKLCLRYRSDDLAQVPPVCIILKDENEEPLKFNHSPETREIERILRHNEEVNSQYNIRAMKSGEDVKLLTALHAIFNQSFELHGRMYTSTKLGYQSLTRSERKTITFDGEPGTECDFEGIGTRLLYAKQHIQYDGDPYLAVIKDRSCRPVVKHLLNIMLNAGDEGAAIEAAWNKINEQRLKHEERYPDCSYNTCTHLGFDLYLSQWRNYLFLKDLHAVARQIRETHSKIEEYFCTGIGIVLMNYDSKIARLVIDHFGKLNVPILSIHDSFIVPSSYGEMLKQVMEDSYFQITGFRCPVSIK